MLCAWIENKLPNSLSSTYDLLELDLWNVSRKLKYVRNCVVMKIIFLTVWCEALKPYKMYVALHPLQDISMIFRKLPPFEATPADAFNFKSASDHPPSLKPQT